MPSAREPAHLFRVEHHDGPEYIAADRMLIDAQGAVRLMVVEEGQTYGEAVGYFLPSPCLSVVRADCLAHPLNITEEN